MLSIFSTFCMFQSAIPLPCKEDAPKNIRSIEMTFDVSKDSKPFPEYDAASLNIASIVVTLRVSKDERSPSKDVAAWNMSDISVTRPVSQSRSWLKDGALRNCGEQEMGYMSHSRLSDYSKNAIPRTIPFISTAFPVSHGSS